MQHCPAGRCHRAEENHLIVEVSWPWSAAIAAYLNSSNYEWTHRIPRKHSIGHNTVSSSLYTSGNCFKVSVFRCFTPYTPRFTHPMEQKMWFVGKSHMSLLSRRTVLLLGCRVNFSLCRLCIVVSISAEASCQLWSPIGSNVRWTVVWNTLVVGSSGRLVVERFHGDSTECIATATVHLCHLWPVETFQVTDFARYNFIRAAH